MLQRPDDRIMCALQNSDHASLASSFNASVGRIPRDASNHAVAVHGCPRVFRRDENVGLARFFADQKPISCLMNVEGTGDQIGCGRQNVSIFPDPRDLTSVFEVAQRLVQTHAHAALPPERPRQFALVQRPIVGRPKKRENLFLNLTSV